MGTIIDLSHVITDGMVTYPGLPGPVIGDHLSRAASHERHAPGYEFQIGRIELVANTGTYLDTPFHRFGDGYDLSELDLARFVSAPGTVIDAPMEGPIDETAVAGHDLSGRAVLLRTGRSRHFGTHRYADPSHPGLTAAAAEFLAAANPSLVGIDSLNLDLTVTGERPAHTTLLAAGILHRRAPHQPRPRDRAVHLHRRPPSRPRHGQLPGPRLRHHVRLNDHRSSRSESTPPSGTEHQHRLHVVDWTATRVAIR